MQASEGIEFRDIQRDKRRHSSGMGKTVMPLADAFSASLWDWILHIMQVYQSGEEFSIA